MGDAYGYEFAKVRLPDNYIFGGSGDVPSNADPVKELSTVIKCYPDSSADSLPTVTIYGKRPKGWTKIGSTRDEMKDI